MKFLTEDVVEVGQVNSGEHCNGPVIDWARQNIRSRVEVRLLFSSRAGVIFIYSLLFCVPGAFFALGLVALVLGVKDRSMISGAFFFGVLLLIPCGVIALLGAYVRKGFVKSLDTEGVSGSFGQRFQWGKLHYVNHVTKHFRAGGVGHRVKDNQLELVFEGGKLIIPPLIHNRAAVWELINGMPVEVRDDGVQRASHVAASGGNPIKTEEDLMMLLKSLNGTRSSGE